MADSFASHSIEGRIERNRLTLLEFELVQPKELVEPMFADYELLEPLGPLGLGVILGVVAGARLVIPGTGLALNDARDGGE